MEYRLVTCLLALLFGSGCDSGRLHPVRLVSHVIEPDSVTESVTDSASTPIDSDTTPGCPDGAVWVDSLSALLPYLDDDNVTVALSPGIYRITTGDVDSGLFSSPHLLEVSGFGSTFCFAGVRLEIETAVLAAFPGQEVVEMRVAGQNNVVQYLTIEDIGATPPAKTAVGVLMEGSDNLVEGVSLTVRGSAPYGYGGLFGVGSNYIIQHFKHLGIVIRGDNQHLKGCTVIHRAFGHGIYISGAINTVIEGCTVEGEVRTTDDILAEEGSGSAADQVDFMTVYGYRVPAGYMVSLQRGGIYAANVGVDSTTGTERHTGQIRVSGCTVINMQSGVNIGFANDQKVVENCVVRGCMEGYNVGADGQVLASFGDAIYGPLYVDNYQSDNNNLVDVTVLDNSERYGNDVLAYIGGSEHQITFRSDGSKVTDGLVIKVAGLRGGLYHQEVNPTYDDFTATGITIDNQTGYPLVLGAKSSGTKGASVGPITDLGTDNAVTQNLSP